MNHMVDYDVIKAKCPPGVEPAYDGLEVEVPDVRRDIAVDSKCARPT